MPGIRAYDPANDGTGPDDRGFRGGRMLPSMSAPASPPARPWVGDDLERMPDDGYRRGTIGGGCRRGMLGGVLIVSPSPALRHQVCSGGLYRALYQARSPEFVVVYAPYD